MSDREAPKELSIFSRRAETSWAGMNTFRVGKARLESEAKLGLGDAQKCGSTEMLRSMIGPGAGRVVRPKSCNYWWTVSFR